MGSYFFISDQFRGLFFSWDTLQKNMYLKSAENLSTNLFFSPEELNQSLGPEAVARRCSVKKVFLENFQNSQESTCVRFSF